MKPTKQIDYDTIVATANGDADAMNRIMHHYAAYIQHFSKRSYYDEYGDCKEYADNPCQMVKHWNRNASQVGTNSCRQKRTFVGIIPECLSDS